MLSIEKLNVSVGDKKILEDFNLKIGKGEVHAIMGTMDQPVDEIGEEACSGSGRGTSSGPAGASQEVSVHSCPLHISVTSPFSFSFRWEVPVRLYSSCSHF